MSTAFLVLLERLGPEQRAVLLLHDVFGLEYGEVAGVVGKSEDACRQIAVRARRHVREDRPRFSATDEDADRLADRFFAAARAGDLDGLVGLLAADAEFVGDGGDSGRGVTRAVRGREQVAKLVRGLFRRVEAADCSLKPIRVGRQPGVRILDADEGLVGVGSLVLGTGGVRAVHGMVNPDKLGHLGLPPTSL